MSAGYFDPYSKSKKGGCTSKENPESKVEFNSWIHIAMHLAVVLSTGDHLGKAVGTGGDM